LPTWPNKKLNTWAYRVSVSVISPKNVGGCPECCHEYHLDVHLSSELTQLGPTARGTIYIQLSNFPQHYLVLVITDDEFRYALISASVVPDSMYGNMVMEDLAWLDLGRIHGEDDKRQEYDGDRQISRVFNPGRCVRFTQSCNNWSMRDG
jgi:hypothetical protein